MLSETEPRHAPPLAARRAQAEGPRTVLHPRLSAGLALQPEQHARRHLGSRENSGTTTCFPIKIGAAAGGSKRLQSGQRALPRGGCPAAVPGASCPVPAGRVGEGASGRGTSISAASRGSSPVPPAPQHPRDCFRGWNVRAAPRTEPGGCSLGAWSLRGTPSDQQRRGCAWTAARGRSGKSSQVRGCRSAGWSCAAALGGCPGLPDPPPCPPRRGRDRRR